MSLVSGIRPKADYNTPAIATPRTTSGSTGHASPVVSGGALRGQAGPTATSPFANALANTTKAYGEGSHLVQNVYSPNNANGNGFVFDTLA